MDFSGQLKTIILENEEFIGRTPHAAVPREGAAFPSAKGKVCVLYGVRRSGKSFLLYDLFKKYQETSVYIDFEDERLEGMAAKDLDGIRDALFELKPGLVEKRGITFLLDEVQNVPGWEKFCRRMVEKEGARVFCAGSSSRIMPRQIHTALRGRSWCVEVLPFSFREVLSAHGVVDASRDLWTPRRKALLKRHFGEYLRMGGFPEIVFAPSEFEKKKILREYMEAMFFKDLIERFDITNIHLFDAMKDKFFSSFSQKYSMTSFYKQYKDKFPFSKDSLFAYYKFFLESGLILEARKFSDSSYQTMRNPPKLYLIDIGLARRDVSEDIGRRLENQVFLELKRRGWEARYFEGRGECDFIVRADGRWEALQVTWRLEEGNRERELDGVAEAAVFLGLKKGVIIIGEGERGEFRHKGVSVKVIPAWEWF